MNSWFRERRLDLLLVAVIILLIWSIVTSAGNEWFAQTMVGLSR